MVLMVRTWLPRSRNSLVLTPQKTLMFPASNYSWKGNQPSSLFLKPQVSLAGFGTHINGITRSVLTCSELLLPSLRF